MRRTVPVPVGHCPEPILEIDFRFLTMRREPDFRRAKHWGKSRYGSHLEYVADGCSGGVPGIDSTDIRKYFRFTDFGDKIMPDAADLHLPWSVAPLEGKYYGTHILDANGEEVAEFWDHSEAAHPSQREKARFGDWTEDAWAEYCCDSHWESERDYVRALAIVTAMNATEAKP